MMPPLPGTDQGIQPNELNAPPAPAHPWSTRFIVIMLLVVGIVSLVGGGAGAYLAVAGLDQAWRLPGSAQDPRLVPLYLGAAAAALLSGQFFWWCFIVRPRHLTPERGAWVSAASSLAAHPFAWLFALLATVVTGGTAANAWALPQAPSVVTILIYAGGYSLYSLILVGWFTALLGGLAGGEIAAVLAPFAESGCGAPGTTFTR
jgi:hypothetical protein